MNIAEWHPRSKNIVLNIKAEALLNQYKCYISNNIEEVYFYSANSSDILLNDASFKDFFLLEKRSVENLNC